MIIVWRRSDRVIAYNRHADIDPNSDPWITSSPDFPFTFEKLGVFTDDQWAAARKLMETSRGPLLAYVVQDKDLNKDLNKFVENAARSA